MLPNAHGAPPPTPERGESQSLIGGTPLSEREIVASTTWDNPSDADLQPSQFCDVSDDEREQRESAAAAAKSSAKAAAPAAKPGGFFGGLLARKGDRGLLAKRADGGMDGLRWCALWIAIKQAGAKRVIGMQGSGQDIAFGFGILRRITANLEFIPVFVLAIKGIEDRVMQILKRLIRTNLNRPAHDRIGLDERLC